MTRNKLSIRVYGTPRPQGSKRYLGNGRFVEASDVKPWRAAIAQAVRDEWQRDDDSTSFEDPVVVTCVFYMRKPKTVFRLWPSVAPDLDKLVRAVGDALNVDCAALKDDSLIVKWEAFKIYAPNPEDEGVSVSIRLASAADLAAGMAEGAEFPGQND